MKNQQTEQMPTTQANPNIVPSTDQILPSTLSQPLVPDVLTAIYCKQKNNSEHACISKNCHEYAFVCQDKDCQCQLNHQECLIIKTAKIIKSIKTKIVSLQPLCDAINQTVDKIIDNLSDFRDKILLQLKAKFQFFGLNADQINILNSLETMKVNELLGAEIYKININPDVKKSFLNEIQITSKIIRDTLILPESITSFIQKAITKLKETQDNYKKNQQKIISSNALTNLINSSFFKHSKIIQSQEQVVTMLQLFKPLKPVLETQSKDYSKLQSYAQTTLLYRASQNQFSTSKFHEVCDGIKNTLTLCKTTTGKIIGGYSVKEWGIYKQKKNSTFEALYVVDDSGDSFIFSLTNNEKFKLKDDKKAILHWKEQQKIGPSFGEKDDLVIHDKANQKFNSSINLNGSYINQAYNLQNGEVDNKRFIGYSNQNIGQSINFSLKEWQVWQIKLFLKI